MSHSRYPTTLYLSAPNMIRLVRRKGLPACIAGVAQRIESDYLRWNEFDKTARVASHSADGVIELMPIADASQFAFKYVNGHPRNTRNGLPTVMAFGVLADVAFKATPKHFSFIFAIASSCAATGVCVMVSAAPMAMARAAAVAWVV